LSYRIVFFNAKARRGNKEERSKRKEIKNISKKKRARLDIQPGIVMRQILFSFVV